VANRWGSDVGPAILPLSILKSPPRIGCHGQENEAIDGGGSPWGSRTRSGAVPGPSSFSHGPDGLAGELLWHISLEQPSSRSLLQARKRPVCPLLVSLRELWLWRHWAALGPVARCGFRSLGGSWGASGTAQRLFAHTPFSAAFHIPHTCKSSRRLAVDVDTRFGADGNHTTLVRRRVAVPSVVLK